MNGQYQQIFQEEARELLAELESALLELDQNRKDQELIGRAFRALHTIKGSGAMFGFNDISAFVHNLESAFDRLRTGQLEVTSDLIAVTLSAGDQIKEMFKEAAGTGVADPARTNALLSQLAQMTNAPKIIVHQESLPALSRGLQTAANLRSWHIRFRPGPELLANGNNPLFILRDVAKLGDLKIKVDTSTVPRLSELNPERCYLTWDLILSTSASVESIREIFIFVENDCELFIEPVLEASQPPPVQQSLSGANSANNASGSSIRVAVDKLDRLVNLVGELVTVQARLGQIAGTREDPDILAISEEVERLTAALRENSMSVRMLPLRPTFERFRRLVHDLSLELDKKVELTTEGADTELDKTIIDQLTDPLLHLIRNSMDHGIENPDDRRRAGKPPSARIHLSAEHSGANVLIKVMDDGGGINIDAVRMRAIERGLISASAQLSETETLSLILAPGFSTAPQVTDLSGRGVGMDVVRRNVEALHGSLDIVSKPGAGVTVTLKLPLTLAIIDGLLVRVGKTHFVLPLAHSLECIELTSREIEAARGNRIANVRGVIIPYIRLSEYFQMESPRPEREQIMVVETEFGQYGFVVDEVLGDHQTVIKSLGKLYKSVQVVSGATILGDGTVALILDPHRLVQSAIRPDASGKRLARP